MKMNKINLEFVGHYVRTEPPQESLDQTFSKVCAVKGAEPLSLSAESEIPNRSKRAGEES